MKTHARRFSSSRSTRPARPALLAAAKENDPPDLSFVVCSVCLRIHLESGWTDPGQVMREIRSWELAIVPPLRPGLCDACRETLRDRRARPPESIAA